MARRQSRWRLRAALFLGVGLALTGAALVAYGANLFRQLEVDSLRARFEVRGATKPPPELVIVDIDTQTLTNLRETWPFRRRHHARVIDRLSDGSFIYEMDDGAKIAVKVTVDRNARRARIDHQHPRHQQLRAWRRRGCGG